MPRPNLVYHADWGKDEHKKWASKAVLNDAGQYAVSVPRKVGTLGSLISNIRSEIGKTGCAFVGFDFPIGIPAGRTPARTVITFLPSAHPCLNVWTIAGFEAQSSKAFPPSVQCASPIPKQSGTALQLSYGTYIADQHRELRIRPKTRR
jgi:hypothetical protein